MASTEDTSTKFQRALDLLRDPEASFTAEAIYNLSDLTPDRLKVLSGMWLDLPAERRANLIMRLVDTAEVNFELDFSSIIHMALDDPEADVRRAAVEGVLEDSPHSIIERLAKMAQEDLFSEVRAAAAGALGMFILLGEYEELPEALATRLQDTALALYRNPNEDLDVRRRALEAISNCGREGVPELIREAYYADELPMRVSAVFAMGRSCDEVWAPQVMEELSSEYPELRFEAARAAGELELRKALPRLTDMAYEDDREIQEAAIWAMGEMGGSAARAALDQLLALAEEVGDDELVDAIQEAQAMATLAGEDLLPLFDFTDLDDEEDDELEMFASLYGDDEDDEDDFDDYQDLDDLVNLDDELF